VKQSQSLNVLMIAPSCSKLQLFSYQPLLWWSQNCTSIDNVWGEMKKLNKG